ncbi:HTH_XRE domain containing protein [uncultured Caudovirales phage]|uniref:HTH_XRE domain containing protein n=1 Tax=uncultured Caudovirales phage TaxID=2100421 RepID=A0A6J5L1Z7_9CAUD|nr:HTH_XRE domain containing protein [uncultured Caudovirales phage]
MNGIEIILENARIRLGFSQEDVAKKAEISVASYRSYENGARRPKYTTAVALQNVLSVDIVSILFPSGQQIHEEPMPGVVEEPSMPYGPAKQVIPLGKHIPARSADGQWIGLPMYNVPISAGFVSQYRDEGTYQPQYYLADNRFRDCNFGAIITGDSMHSEIRHGDYVVCKEINDPTFIVYGEIYYVVAKNGMETCKYINANPKDDDSLLLVPRNEKISPSPIKKEMILKLYKVRGIVRGY